MSGRHYGTPKRRDRALPARDAKKMCDVPVRTESAGSARHDVENLKLFIGDQQSKAGPC